MQICSNTICKLYVEKQSQSGTICSRCKSDLFAYEAEESSGEKFDLVTLLKSKKKLFLFIGLILLCCTVGLLFFKQQTTIGNDQSNKSAPSTQTDVIPYDSIGAAILKVHILNEYKIGIKESLDKLRDFKATNLLTNESMDKTIVLSGISDAYSWEIASITTSGIDIRVLPTKANLLDFLKQGNRTELKKYINENGFSLNHQKSTLQTWMSEYQRNKNTVYNLIIRNPEGGIYQRVEVFIAQQSIYTPATYPSERSWRKENVDIGTQILPEEKEQAHDNVKALKSLLDYAKTKSVSIDEIREYGLKDPLGTVRIHNTRTGDHQATIEEYFKNLFRTCPNCTILPIRCTPYFEKIDQKNQISFKTIELVEYPR